MEKHLEQKSDVPTVSLPLLLHQFQLVSVSGHRSLLDSLDSDFRLNDIPAKRLLGVRLLVLLIEL